MSQSLEGVRILDLTRVLSGPYATMILADMGADVTKVERPGTGDDSRAFGPYNHGESAYFMSLNRNKKSITMNLKSEKAKEIFLTLIKDFDVVVENFRPGTMEKLGLGYEELKKVNPKLIYAAVSGFGATGPYSKRPAYDGVVQALGGIMSITGEKNGSPLRVGSSIGDIVAGIFTATGILSALYHEEKTGEGQKVDVAMLDCQIAILENAISRYLVSGVSPKPEGNKHPSIIPFETFDTKNGVIMIAAGNDALFKKLCAELGMPDLATDERFVTNPLRGENYDELRPILSDAVYKKTTEEWIEILNTAGVPNAPVNDVEHAVNDPQVQAREMLLEIPHPRTGEPMQLPGIPIKMSKTQGEITLSPPLLGQHTDEFLKEFANLSADEIEDLRKDGII